MPCRLAQLLMTLSDLESFHTMCAMSALAELLVTFCFVFLESKVVTRDEQF